MSLFASTTTQPPSASTCPPDMSQQVDDLTQKLMDRDSTIQQQHSQIDQLQGEIPAMKQSIYDLNKDIQSNYTITQEENRRFYVTYLSVVLLLVFSFVIYLYNLLLMNNMMPMLNKARIFHDWVEIMKQGFDKSTVDTDELIKQRIGEWEPVLGQIQQLLSRSRFFLFLVMMAIMIGGTMFMYSLIYRGNDSRGTLKPVAVCFLLVLGFTFLIINNDSMIRPFENVIGSSVVNATNKTNVNETMRGIFQHKYFTTTSLFPQANLYFDFLLNTFSLKNIPEVVFDVFYKNHKYDFAINIAPPGDQTEGLSKTKLDSLFKYVLQKHTIGHSCWIYFASLVGTMISMKHLLSTL